MSAIPSELIKKYNLYKTKIDKNNKVISSMGVGLGINDEPSSRGILLSISCIAGHSSHRVGEFELNKDLSVDIMKKIIDGIKRENKPMIEFCENFEAAVAEAYAKEQGYEPPPVKNEATYGHSRLR